MKLDYYSWPPRRTMTADIPMRPTVIETNAPLDGENEAAAYVPHPDLVSAVNVALVLGRPLLVTGEPGTGKTRLANSVAWQLGFAGPFKFVAKSTSVARDLFYTYDALGRFYEAEAMKNGSKSGRDPGKPLGFIDFSALGKAILLAHEASSVLPFVDKAEGARSDHPGPVTRSVVLIDEADKAPRDFPNDLLDELVSMQFRIPEMHDIETPELTDCSRRPVIIITSNRERQLPDAFLRRCIYFEIPFPKRHDEASEREREGGYTIEDIIARRLGGVAVNVVKDSRLFADAFDFFYMLRALGEPLQKQPATAELIDWLDALKRIDANTTQPLRLQPDAGRATIFTLLKGGADLTRGRAHYEDWVAGRIAKVAG